MEQDKVKIKISHGSDIPSHSWVHPIDWIPDVSWWEVEEGSSVKFVDNVLYDEQGHQLAGLAMEANPVFNGSSITVDIKELVWCLCRKCKILDHPVKVDHFNT